MTEHERIIVQAAANILREQVAILWSAYPPAGMDDPLYVGSCCSHAAAEIEYALKRLDASAEADAPEPDSRKAG